MDSSSLDSKNLIVKSASSNLSIDELLDKIASMNGKKSIIQIFDANSVFGESHLIAAYINALIAFENESNRTKRLDLEMLLFASATDQIGKAIKKVGAKSSHKFAVFSNDSKLIKELGKFVRYSEFKPPQIQAKRVARSFGIKETNDRKEMELMILQKIALSRIG